MNMETKISQNIPDSESEFDEIYKAFGDCYVMLVSLGMLEKCRQTMKKFEDILERHNDAVTGWPDAADAKAREAFNSQENMRIDEIADMLSKP